MRKVGNTETLAAVTLVFAVLIAVAALVFIFTPYKPISYNLVDPGRGPFCVTTPLKTKVDFEIKPELYNTIRNMHIDSNWVAVNVDGYPKGARRDAGETTIEAHELKPGRTVATGNLIRVTPEIPGEWELVNDYSVVGVRAVWPPVQRFSVKAPAPTVVVASNDPACKG